MSTSVEAKLIISGQDTGASAAVRQVVNAFKQMGEATKISSQVDKLTRSLLEQQKAASAVAAAMKARAGYDALQGDLKRTNAALAANAKAYDDAKRAKAAFDGVKAPKGSDQARQIAEVNKALREAGTAYRKAEGDVRRVNAAVSAQASVMHAAERAAAGFGANLSNLAAHERKLVGAIDAGTAALKRQMAAEEHGARVSGQAAARRERRVEATKALGSMAGIYVGHKAGEAVRASTHTYAEVDDLLRYQAAVSDLTPEERRSRMHQANHLGATTGYDDRQVLHAQLDLAQRGVKKEFIEPFIGEIVSFAQAMNTDLGSAAKTMEGVVFTTNQDVETPATAQKNMRRQVDLAVRMAKLGGLDGEDIKQAFKFGGPTGSGAGLSNETMGTVFSLLRRSGFDGSEAGVATRAIGSKLVAPTSKGMNVLAAMDMPYDRYVRMPVQMRSNAAENIMKQSFGKSLSAAQKAAFDRIANDSDILGDQGKFIEASTKIASGSFEKGKKGKLRAQDQKAIAKAFQTLWKNIIESVDSERLWNDFIHAKPTLAQSNTFFTDKHGGKVHAISKKAELYDETKHKLQETPEGFAKGIGDKRMEGYSGAVKRLAGAKVNLETSMARSWDDNGEGKGGPLTAVTDAVAKAVQALSELPAPVQQAGSAALYLGGKLTEAAGTLGLMGSALALTKSAAELSAAAAVLSRGGAGGLPPGAPPGTPPGTPPGGPPGGRPPGVPPRATLPGAIGFMGVAGALGYIGWKGLEAVDAWMPTARPGARFSPLGNPIPGKGGEVYGPPMPTQRPRSLRQIRNGLDADDKPWSPPPAPQPAPAIPTAPSMTMQPGNASPGIGTTGLKAFGLDGIAEGAAKAGQDAGAKAGDGMRQGIEGKRSEVIGSAQQTFASIQAVFGAGVTVPVKFDTSGVAAAASAAKAAASSGASQMAQAISTPLPAAARGGGVKGAADSLNEAAGKFADASLRTHHTVEVSASPGLQARTRAMQASARGPIRADVGVSMPGARDADWA
ncbi:phage tail tape measure protein [Methylobacterium aquaticum]|uniref:phage tail tape measure protein n=1 Tax=Methylobacterium aquaticum TaxID=270351 RepID=UPI003D16F4F3